MEIMKEFGMNNEFIINCWFQLSILIQLATSGFLMLLSANQLNPLKNGKKKSEKALARAEKREAKAAAKELKKLEKREAKATAKAEK